MSRKTTAAIVKKLRRSFALVPAMSILIVGCSSSSNDAAAASNGSAGAAKSGQKSGGANYVKFDPLSGQVAKAAITDPTLNNMVAANLTIPAGWKLQGMMLMPPCAPAPYPVFRAYSPDGLMQFRYEPVFGWRWSSNYKPDQTGCAPISGVISAADFLKYYVETMQGGVHVVGTMPVPATTTQTAQRLATEANQNNSRLAPMMQHKNTGDAAALRVEVVNGSFVVEERLRVVVECAVNAPSGPLPAWAKQVKPVDGGTCWARLDVLTAPKGKLDTLVQLADSNDLPHGALTPEWNQASMRQLSEKNAREGEQRLEGGPGRVASLPRHDVQRVPAEHGAFGVSTRGIYGATGVVVQELDEQCERGDERAYHGSVGLGGLCVGPTDGDRSGRNRKSFKRLLTDLVEWAGSVVPDQQPECQSQRGATRKLDACNAGAWKRAAEVVRESRSHSSRPRVASLTKDDASFLKFRAQSPLVVSFDPTLLRQRDTPFLAFGARKRKPYSRFTQNL
jgi:hypothetical protein